MKFWNAIHGNEMLLRVESWKMRVGPDYWYGCSELNWFKQSNQIWHKVDWILDELNQMDLEHIARSKSWPCGAEDTSWHKVANQVGASLGRYTEEWIERVLSSNEVWWTSRGLKFEFQKPGIRAIHPITPPHQTRYLRIFLSPTSSYNLNPFWLQAPFIWPFIFIIWLCWHRFSFTNYPASCCIDILMFLINPVVNCTKESFHRGYIAAWSND